MVRYLGRITEILKSASRQRDRKRIKAIGLMMSKSDTDDGQLHRFRDAARQLECDDDEVKFAATLKKVAKTKPPAEPEKK